MKKIILLFFLIIYSHGFSQVTISEVEKNKQFGLVWGLLKYHHPEISNGKYDWDLEYVNTSSSLDTIKNQDGMNAFLFRFISKFKTDKLKTKKLTTERLFVKNVDYDWIDETVFGKQLTKTLLEIKENSNKNNYYASTNKLAKMLSFDNEKGYQDFNYANKNHRLLLLYSFWNAIQYWNVNKYLMDDNWVSILHPMTELFINCNTKLEFEIAKSKLIAKLDDSHSYHLSNIVFDTLFKNKPYFSVKTINDSLLVTSIFNKSLAKKDGLELGDIITKVNNTDISTAIHEKIAPILSVSNKSFLNKWCNWLFYSQSDSINVAINKKNGSGKNQYIHLYEKYEVENPTYLWTERNDKWTLIKPDIAYINLDEITQKELKAVFKQIANITKGLILDLRKNTKNIRESDLSDFLYPKNKEFIKVLFPMENYPSYGEYDGEAPLKLISNPFHSGKNNPDYYKGKVILLVNRRTQSKGEYIGMAIQQSPNCVTIGEQTAGSVMNIVSYRMPDKTEVYFTGLGGFYPNGDEVQRKGLKIDYNIKESTKNYDPELYIKEAIKIIEN